MLAPGSIAVALLVGAPNFVIAEAPASGPVRPGELRLKVTPPDLVPPVIPERVQREQLRRLKIKTAVAWTFAGIGLVGLTVPLVMLATCDESAGLVSSCPAGPGPIIAATIFGTLAAASLIPA